MKITSSSIIEVIVAMLILSIIFSIGLVSFIQINSSSKRMATVKYQAELDHIAQILKNGEIPNVSDQPLNIKWTISDYQNNPNLKMIEIKAVLDSSTIASHYELWFKE